MKRDISSDSKSTGDLRPFPIDKLWIIGNARKNSVLCTKCRKDVLNYALAIESQTLEESPSQIFSDISSNQGSTLGTVEDSIDVILDVSPVKKKLYVYLHPLFKLV